MKDISGALEAIEEARYKRQDSRKSGRPLKLPVTNPDSLNTALR